MPRSHEDDSDLQAIVRRLTDAQIAKTHDLPDLPDLLLVAPCWDELEDNLINLVSDLYVDGDLVSDRDLIPDDGAMTLYNI